MESSKMGLGRDIFHTEPGMIPGYGGGGSSGSSKPE